MPGIIKKLLRQFGDERDFLTKIMRMGWPDIIQVKIVLPYVSNYPHKHELGDRLTVFW